jgi:protein gp37
MSDFFHPKVKWQYQLRILEVVKECDWHLFMLLTKRAQQMDLFEEYGSLDYPNLYVGVTGETQYWTDVRIWNGWIGLFVVEKRGRKHAL